MADESLTNTVGVDPVRERVRQNLAFVRGTVEVDLAINPPNLQNTATFPQSFNVQMATDVRSVDQLSGEFVPSSSGAIIWWVNRGIGDIYRFGFVPINTTSVTTNTNWSPGAPTGVANATLPSLVQSISYTAPLALPYGSSEAINPNPDDLVAVSDITEELSKARVIAGRLDLQSPSLGNINSILKGAMATAAINDIRQVAQVQDQASGAWSAYSAQNIDSQSVTRKDGQTNVEVDKGVAVLQGCDISPVYKAPLMDNVTEDNGENTTRTLPGLGAPTYTTLAGVRGDVHSLAAWWVTPNETSATSWFGTTAYATPTNRIRVDTISDLDVLDITIDNLVVAAAPGTDPNTADWAFQHVVYATHVFASVSVSGQIFYQGFQEEQRFPGRALDFYPAIPPNVLADVGLALGRFPPLHFNGKRFQTSYTGVGKYVGTMINVLIVMEQDADPDHPIIVQLTPDAPFTDTMPTQRTTITTRPWQGEVFGMVGPVRIMRWEATTATARINLSGKLAAQVIAKGRLAQYTREQVMMTMQAVDAQMLVVLPLLYNGRNTNFRRAWRRIDLEKARLEFFDVNNFHDQIIQYMQNDPNVAQAAAAFQAGGFFSDLWSGIKNVGKVAAKVALPLAAKAVGGLLHAGGQFATEAGGQFDAAGEFDDGDDPTAARFNQRARRVDTRSLDEHFDPDAMTNAVETMRANYDVRGAKRRGRS